MSSIKLSVIFLIVGFIGIAGSYYGGVIDDAYFFMTSGGDTSPITNEDDVTLYLSYNTSNPDFDSGSFNNLSAVVDDNNVMIDWDIVTSSAPQFSYHIKIYDNAGLIGDPLISKPNIKPHLRNDSIDISALPDNQEYFLQFYIRDIFDNTSGAEVVPFFK